MRYMLVDNGSLRAESILNLRRLASELSGVTGLEIFPASLLHSSKVPATELNGVPAVNLERRLRLFLEAGEREFTIIPFFFGPSGAVLEYLPSRLAYRREQHGSFRVEQTPFLYPGGNADNPDLLQILASRVLETMESKQLGRPKVALVDHGSPLRRVTAVRDALAEELAGELGPRVSVVAPASMERREGEAYAFNEPLLENLLSQPGWNSGPVVISMLFLSPGRHAGPEGDIAAICRDAERRNPGLKTHMTGLVGDHPGIVPLLVRRLKMPRIRL